MNHEEKTAEIELPSFAEQNNIVHVDFTAGLEARRSSAGSSRLTDRRTDGAALPLPPPPTIPMPPPPVEAPQPWMTDFDPRSPWVLRLLAVLFVLILSMLVL